MELAGDSSMVQVDDRSRVVPFSLKDTPALIEKLLPVQKLSAEAYKESMAGSGKTLTGLGTYWKGRKALVLNRAIILGSLLPATDDLHTDLEVFEMLMAIDTESVKVRLLDKSRSEFKKLEASGFALSYKELISKASRPEECPAELFDHIWDKVNAHLETNARSYPELVEQLGIMRYGHRPKFVDTFSGSGQIPFEAARLGCNVYASDLNPIALMLTWGAFNIVGANEDTRADLTRAQAELVKRVRGQIDELGIESDGNGYRAKAYLYCLEVVDPNTNWRVPVMSSLVVVKQSNVVAKLIPNYESRSFDIDIVHGVTDLEMEEAANGTYSDGTIHYKIGESEHRVKLSTIRGDYKDSHGRNANNLRKWDKLDFIPRADDIFQERLYAVQWIKDGGTKGAEKAEFRAVTVDDLKREQLVIDYVAANLADWQEAGFVPDMRIEAGEKTDEPIRTRGWTYWHHLFNSRQLLIGALVNKESGGDARLKIGLAQVLNFGSRLSRWDRSSANGAVKDTFYSQALNTLYDYGSRGVDSLKHQLGAEYKSFPLDQSITTEVHPLPASAFSSDFDIAITDPPYGDAVKYEEIYEFFIGWLRKNPPKEFANWVWDSRRALAIKGEDHNFKIEMVNAYKALTKHMADNGVQVIMFTHQSGNIWADMANIVWASGLQVSAAWYVVTETDSALRDGQYVKGTIMLVLRKRLGKSETFRDEIAYEIEDEVKRQIESLTGLNQDSKDLYRDENLFEDADLQMAGYAAALRVLTKYSTIDGADMANEALRPRIKKQKTIVDELVDYAVGKANEYLVPSGLDQSTWDSLTNIERFYLKMLDQESSGIFTMSNYQNFAKAFKVKDYSPLMAEAKANKGRIRGAVDFNKRSMTDGDEFGPTLVRSVLYGIYLIASSDIDGDKVLAQLKQLIPTYYQERTVVATIANYIARKFEGNGPSSRPKESEAAIILRDLIRNERV